MDLNCWWVTKLSNFHFIPECGHKKKQQTAKLKQWKRTKQILVQWFCTFSCNVSVRVEVTKNWLSIAYILESSFWWLSDSEELSFWPNIYHSMHDIKQYSLCFSANKKGLREMLCSWSPFIPVAFRDLKLQNKSSHLFLISEQEAQVWAGKPKQRIQSPSRSKLSSRQI